MFTVAEILKAVGGRTERAGQPERRICGVSIDSRVILHGQAFIAVKGENFDGHSFLKEASAGGAVCLIVSAGKRLSIPAGPAVIRVKDTVKALADLAHFHRMRFDIPLIAVTGSNGKTTTKDMTARVLSSDYRVLKNEGTKNNHIGMPLALLGLTAAHQAAVLELGSNHPGEIAYLAGICRPTIAVITNIGPSHLEHFGSLRGVLREKSSLLKFLRGPAIALLNADDKMLSRVVKKRRVFSYGASSGADFLASCIRNTGGGVEFLPGRGQKRKCRLKTVGTHNALNALAAASVGRMLGISYPDICSRLNEFDFPAGRMKLLDKKEAAFIDDTYNSNPFSLNRALSALGGMPSQGRKIFVMGDMLELGPASEKFHCLAGEQAAGVCDVFIAVGNLSRSAAKAALGAGLSADKVFCCEDAAQAGSILRGRIDIVRQDVVLVKGSRGMRMERVFEETRGTKHEARGTQLQKQSTDHSR
ncbi:MAG: UDP-N-acetylmuramoyl-tripeptide--D-alanyl-D-alanine ligase [Candidatus Omnitrophota bacterium]